MIGILLVALAVFTVLLLSRLGSQKKGQAQVIKRDGHTPVKILVGLILLFLILILMNEGDIEDVMGFVLLSVVCTAGLGLIPWFLFAWIAGEIFFGILKVFNVDPFPSATIIGAAQNAPADTSPELYQLVGYIRKAHGHGYSSEQVKERLMKNGWTEAEINEADKLS